MKQQQPHVILLHGVLMNPVMMSYLAYQLRNSGFIVHNLSYQSILKTPAENAVILQQKIAELNLNTLHFVAHSLGGIITAHLLANSPQRLQGRIVMLGTPINGSWLAKKLQHIPLINKILANSLHAGLSGKNIPQWQTKHRWGMIAGEAKLGLALLVGGLPHKGDGTVMIKETQHPQIHAHTTLTVSHTAMLYSKKTAQHTLHFLKTGTFPQG